MDILARMKTRTGEIDEDKLTDMILSAKEAILSARYPFGRPENAEVPEQYLDLQFQIALAIYNKEGADYETSHTENGITRTWGTEAIPRYLLNQIVPVCGVTR